MSAESAYKCVQCGYEWEAIPPSTRCPECFKHDHDCSGFNALISELWMWKSLYLQANIELQKANRGLRRLSKGRNSKYDLGHTCKYSEDGGPCVICGKTMFEPLI